MKLLTRCTYFMALRMRQVQAHSYFFCNNPTIRILLNRGWVRHSEVWQYELTEEGYGRLCEWKQNKRKNYRHIAFHNAIYLTGATNGTGSAFYYPAPGDKRAGEQVILDSFIIGDMIENGQLTYNTDDGYWFARHVEAPENRSAQLSCCDIPF